MIDLLFLAHNRKEFTEASLSALIKNTNWSEVRRLLIYDDASSDGTREFLVGADYPIRPEFRFGLFGSPVAVMNQFLCSCDPMLDSIFAKIDSDTMVPPHWLDECLMVMHKHPDLHLLGIEAFNTVAPWRQGIGRSYTQARHIGGIGLMRSGAFVTLPRPSGRFGFTAWQQKSTDVNKGWINPSLPVFLLDRLPREPWLSHSKRYIAEGWQREWGPYEESMKNMWSWWCE